MAEPANFEDLRNTTIVLFIVTFFVTSYRCFARYKKRLWWHDDSVALVSALSFTVFLVGSIYLAQKSPSPAVRTAGTYILTVGFYMPVWGGRVSIVLTVVRITPWRLQRRILLCVAVLFVLLFAMLTAQTFWVCEITYTGWKQIPGSICLVPRVVPISLVVTTVISDAILIATPLMVVRGVHIRALRFRLFSIFSMSMATTLASLAHAALVMVKPGVWEAIFGGVAAAVSVTVCSMSVIIPAIFRALGVGDPFMRSDTVDPSFITSIEMARMTSGGIELSLPTSHSTGITDSTKSEGGIGTVGSQQRDTVGLDVKGDRKHRLTTRVSDGSLGNLKPTKAAPFVNQSDITAPLAQVRSLPAVKKDQDIEGKIGGKHSKSDST